VPFAASCLGSRLVAAAWLIVRHGEVAVPHVWRRKMTADMKMLLVLAGLVVVFLVAVPLISKFAKSKDKHTDGQKE